MGLPFEKICPSAASASNARVATVLVTPVAARPSTTFVADSGRLYLSMYYNILLSAALWVIFGALGFS
jgi:hypothetical protein